MFHRPAQLTECPFPAAGIWQQRGREGKDVEIRPYQPTDLETLRQITVEAFEGVSIDQNIEQQFGEIAGQSWQFRKGRHLDQDVSRDSAGIFVGTLDGEIIGSISTWMDQEAGIGHVPNLTLRAGYRGRGFGRQLLQFALNRFHEQGLSHVRIETLEQNAIGQQFYLSTGFREVARQIHYCGQLEECLSQLNNRDRTS